MDARMRELYSTGVPVPFECQFACRVKKTDCAKIEKALHTAFSPQRVNANREFFRIQVEQAKAILELFHHEDVTEEVTDEIENDLTPDDKAATQNAKVRRPSRNCYEMGMKKGDVVRWREEPSISVVIDSERRVIYQDEEVFIIGGASVYAEALPLAHRLYLTEVDATAEHADVWFPELFRDDWRLVRSVAHEPDEKKEKKYKFTKYERVTR